MKQNRVVLKFEPFLKFDKKNLCRVFSQIQYKSVRHGHFESCSPLPAQMEEFALI